VYSASLYVLLFRFFLLTDFPSSFAEFGGIGSANSPWTANLGLCARMAHQTGALAMPPNSGTRRANDMGRPFLVTFWGCSQKVTRQWGETHNAKVNKTKNCTKHQTYKAGNSKLNQV